jgi:hypothetical protein
MRKLHPCPSCARHIRAGETACPFCDAALPETFGASAPAQSRGRPMSRAALLFAVAAVAAGCGGSTDSSVGPTDGGRDAAREASGDDEPDALPVAMYGPAPIQDAAPIRPDGSPDAGTDSGGEFDGATGVMYGPAPIEDAG